MYPHSITAVLSTKNRNVVRRNAVLLPAYSFLLGLIALLGYMAIAAHIKVTNTNLVVPELFQSQFPHWFVGIAFSAIAIGALVPAAIMSIAAANLWTRSVYRAYLRPDCTDADEAHQAKLASLLVKFGALVFVLALPMTYAINLQLLGGIWIIQTLPALVFGLYTRWFHGRALALGWLVGMVMGTWLEALLEFKGAVYPLHVFGTIVPTYIALLTLIVNIVIAVLLTPLFRLFGTTEGIDQTTRADSSADELLRATDG
jgi:SSS family solute:Na+ symporter